jgi:hypothetical protein
MKTILLPVIFLITSLNIYAQTKERFCIVEITRNNTLEELYLSVDSGQKSVDKSNYVKDSARRRKVFISEAHALNFVGSLGWKIVAFKPEFKEMSTSESIFIFMKEE